MPKASVSLVLLACEFLYCVPLLADDTHIVGPPARVVEAFSHFVVQLALLGLSVQPSKFVAWSPSGLTAFAVLPKGVSYAIEGIRLLGVPLWT